MQNNLVLEQGVDYLVRIESPGECKETTKLFIELGGKPYTKQEKGELTNFDAWYRGWQIVLKNIQQLGERYSLQYMNSPESIALAFDKKATHHYLSTKTIAQPKVFGTFRTFEEFKQFLYPSYNQLFLKPRFGSSASGVIALRTHKQRLVAYTSLTRKGNRLFNSLKLKRYTRLEELQAILNLANTEFIAQQWIQKLQYKNQSVDFRVIVIAGKAEFIVPRMSQHMITNIHLGNQKGTIHHFSQQQIETIRRFSEQVAHHLPALKYCGLDILLDAQSKPYLIEVNAFGDLLLNITNQQGLTTYEQEAKILC